MNTNIKEKIQDPVSGMWGFTVMRGQRKGQSVGTVHRQMVYMFCLIDKIWKSTLYNEATFRSNEIFVRQTQHRQYTV